MPIKLLPPSTKPRLKPIVHAWKKTTKEKLVKPKSFPPVIMPEQPGGYIKCKKHDFF